MYRQQTDEKIAETNLAIPNRGTLISLAAFVDRIHVNNEKER